MLMPYPFNDTVFHRMGKRAMAHIMQYYGTKKTFLLGIGHLDFLIAQYLDHLLHQVHTAQGVMETGVVEEKGIYSVEKFLMARRFMYWQVYLHKTGLVAEQLLIRVLQRAKYLLGRGEVLHCSAALHFFMRHQIAYRDFTTENIEMFSKLDDIDVLSAIKNWKDHSDVVLSRLCTMLINRDLLHIKMKDRPINGHKLDKHLRRVQDAYSISREEAGYFVFEGMVENQAYSQEKQVIHILRKNGKLVDVARASDHLNLKALSRSVKKYYICFPKGFI